MHTVPYARYRCGRIWREVLVKLKRLHSSFPPPPPPPPPPLIPPLRCIRCIKQECPGSRCRATDAISRWQLISGGSLAGPGQVSTTLLLMDANFIVKIVHGVLPNQKHASGSQTVVTTTPRVMDPRGYLRRANFRYYLTTVRICWFYLNIWYFDGNYYI